MTNDGEAERNIIQNRKRIMSLVPLRLCHWFFGMDKHY